jgi:putative oxidoreductase
MISDLNTLIAIGTVRIIAGILFFFQGYDKVFNVGMAELKRTINAGFGGNKLPASLIGIIAVFTSYTELICGFLLIIGFFKYFALYLLCLDLLVVSFGFSMTKPMWEPINVFSRLLLILILLLTPIEWDKFSIDYLFELSKLKI